MSRNYRGDSSSQQTKTSRLRLEAKAQNPEPKAQAQKPKPKSPSPKAQAQSLRKPHSRQLAHHVAFAHLLEHLSHLGVLAKQVVYFLHSGS
jgi:hypothetical protein